MMDYSVFFFFLYLLFYSKSILNLHLLFILPYLLQLFWNKNNDAFGHAMVSSLQVHIIVER